MTRDAKQRISELSPAQRDLLLRRLARMERPAQERSQLSPGQPGDGGAAPLSFAQERAWFLDRLVPANPAHTLAGALRLTGRLSLPALAATLDRILRRHPPLRAVFSAAPEGHPVQAFQPPRPLPLGVVDLAGLETQRRKLTERRLYRETTRRGFDLSRDLLLRAMLLRLDPEEHLLLLALHRIAADGWSIGVLMAEIAQLYSAFVQGREPDLAALPVHYADVAAWQRQRMQGVALERELAYWRQQLASPPPVLELPPDRSPERGDGRDLGGATCSLCLDEALQQELDALSRRQDTTLFVTLLSAFLVLLMRLTGREDLLLGSPVSGRTRVETEGLVGLFVNTLVLRARLSPALTFRQVLAIVRQVVLDALAHAEVPFERVVQEIDAERSASGQPLFETVFNFTPGPTRRLELPGLTASFEAPAEMGAKFSLELFVTDSEDTLELKLLYPKERYAEARLVVFLDQLEAVLRQAVQDPELPVGTLDLVTPRWRPLLPDPAARLEMPEQPTVASSITAWVARTPEQPAIAQGATLLTYGQLGARMTAVARHLEERGLEPGQVVAVLGVRSPGVIVAMAGVLESGGVLLTLSHDLPPERHRLMLQEAGARFLLQVGERRREDAWLETMQGLTFVRLSVEGSLSDAATAPEPPAADRTSPAPPAQHDPAYVFFTSGSTGTPKGVLGSHAGLAHFLAWQRQTFAVGPGDRGGQLTGLSFDVVLRDVFLPLTSGATLVLPAEDDVASGERTLRWLESEGITLLHTVPALVETWLLAPPADVTLASLQRIFFAGEPLTASLIERWRRAFPRAGEIVNLYGPTETTLAKCFYRVPATPRPGVQPLGRPLPQTQALVLTPERRLCGLGEPGEIALRTPFRSLGYVNAPEENAARFLVHPFRDDPDDLLYLTGDRGVYGFDGLLEFRGRLDHQVKVRGVRVEPTEIAATLQTCPDVAACAVVAREDGPNGTALVAYVVPAPGTGENAGRLQEFLRQRLPAALVPAAFVFLERLPLNANQKLDREQLPPPSGFRPHLKSRYVAPRDATELRLVQVWEDLLGIRPVGVQDSFFDLGGHSLMALHLLMQIDQRLGKKISLATLFAGPTIEHLADAARQQETERSRAVALWSAEHRQKLFLVHPGGGTLLNYVHLVRHLAASVPVYGLQARGLEGEAEPHRDLAQMAADYVDEVRRLQPEGPYLLAGHSLGGVIAFEMARQLQAQDQAVALLALFDAAPPRPAGGERSTGDERLADARSLANMTATIERFVGREVGVTYEALAPLTSDEQVEYVLAALTRSDAFPLGGGSDTVRHLLTVSKAHVEAGRTYQPRPSPVPITLFRARQTSGEDDLGWSAVTTAPVRIVWLPGDHVTILSEPHVESLAEALRASLAAALNPDVG